MPYDNAAGINAINQGLQDLLGAKQRKQGREAMSAANELYQSGGYVGPDQLMQIATEFDQDPKGFMERLEPQQRAQYTKAMQVTGPMIMKAMDDGTLSPEEFERIQQQTGVPMEMLTVSASAVGDFMGKVTGPAPEPFTLGPNQARFSGDGGLTAYNPGPPEAAKPPQTRTIKKGDQEVTQEWDESKGQWRDIAEAPRWSGDKSAFRMTTEDGQEIYFGPQSGMGEPTTSTKNKLQQKAIDFNESYARVTDIMEKFRPEYLEIPTRLGFKWDQIKSKAGADLAPEKRAALEDYADFRRTAIEDINLYIKAITGAQMSEKEATRIRLAKADPGEGVFDGDDPVTFESKLKSDMRNIRLAQARYNYYLNQDLSEERIQEIISNDRGMSLNDMEAIVESRGDEIASRMKQEFPDVTQQEIDAAVSAQLRREFNL